MATSSGNATLIVIFLVFFLIIIAIWVRNASFVDSF